MEAVATRRRVSVVGCNSSGKDWTAGRAVLWWLSTRYPAKVIVTGPTHRQVDDIVWNETRFAYANAKVPLGGHMYQTARFQGFLFGTKEPDPRHFALGFSTSDEYNLQGFHSENLLVIITEAHAMARRDITALRRLNPACMLMTGNPLATSGEFYDSHHSQRGLYATISISAFDTPNIVQRRTVIPGMVTIQDIEDRREEWGEDSPLYVAGVLGEFPENLDDTIVPLSAAVMAGKRYTSWDELKVTNATGAEVRNQAILAVDVARFGEDKTVAVERRGNKARIVWRVQGRDLMKIAGWLRNYMENNRIDALVVDDVGVGGGVTDRLREVGIQVRAFNAGARANDTEHYANAGSEVWMLMRKWFLEQEPAIENDPTLIGQLTTRGYSYQSDRRVIIESKKVMKKNLTPSPDEADALAMTFAPPAPMPRVRFLE